jgi:hypothetical protein
LTASVSAGAQAWGFAAAQAPETFKNIEAIAAKRQDFTILLIVISLVNELTKAFARWAAVSPSSFGEPKPKPSTNSGLASALLHTQSSGQLNHDQSLDPRKLDQ